jgi:hypothetical protein
LEKEPQQQQEEQQQQSKNTHMFLCLCSLLLFEDVWVVSWRGTLKTLTEVEGDQFSNVTF